MHLHFHLTVEIIKSCKNLQKNNNIGIKKVKGYLDEKTFIYR